MRDVVKTYRSAGQMIVKRLPLALLLLSVACSSSTEPSITIDGSGDDVQAPGDLLDSTTDWNSGQDGVHGKDTGLGDADGDDVHWSSGEVEVAGEAWGELSTDLPTMDCAPDQCDIDGECYDNLAVHPELPCLACLVLVDRFDWSADDSLTCDDDDACTQDDYCFEGLCAGWPKVCPASAHACAVYHCDAATGDCVLTDAQGPCDDGNVCSLGDSCLGGSCQPGKAMLKCPESTECTLWSCDPVDGCLAVHNDGVPCDDGDPCTLDSTCHAGVCLAGDRIDCSDSNLCTADACDADGQCIHVSVSHLCADDNPCTDETCDPAVGCVYPFNTLPCNDGNACTTLDTCLLGACIGTPIVPNDNNPCTDDFCDPLTGPWSANNTLPCSDGNACTVGDQCAAGSCVSGAKPLDCPTDVCTDAACDPDVGCVYTFNSHPCSDTNLCTEGDTCVLGQCLGTPVTCDDGNDCTANLCHPAAGCVFEPIVSNACRPHILVDYPPRGATIAGTAPPLVVVTGTVFSGAGLITDFTLNGLTVDVNPADGSFSYPLAARVGHNTLHFVAEDAVGNTKDRVQGFHWSTEYRKPVGAVPGSGMVDPGMGFWLSQETLDDGDHSLPVNDLATVFEMVFSNLDLAALIPNPVVKNQDISGLAKYDLYIQNLTYGAATTTLKAIDGGIRVRATIPNLKADLRAVRVSCPFICIMPATVTGKMTMTSIVMLADLMISVNPDHTLRVDVENVSVTINGLDVNLDGILGFFVNWIIDIFIPQFKSDIEEQFEAALVDTLGPMLEDALSALAINLTFPLPRLDGAVDPGTGLPKTIDVTLQSDFSHATFLADTGGEFGLRARSYAAQRGVPAGNPFDANLGIPGRVGCLKVPQTLAVPRVAPVEVILADDTLNQILRGAWWGGLLEFPVGPALLGNMDLSQYGVTDLSMHISALLPPLASDCPSQEELRLFVADMKVTASLKLFGIPMDIVVYAAFEATIEITTANNELGIVISGIESVLLDVTVLQDSLIGSEQVIHDLLLAQLMPALGGLLGGGEPLASMPLPAIDLSSAVGQPPGSIVLNIGILDNPAWERRINGNTIVYGRLQ